MYAHMENEREIFFLQRKMGVRTTCGIYVRTYVVCRLENSVFHANSTWNTAVKMYKSGAQSFCYFQADWGSRGVFLACTVLA